MAESLPGDVPSTSTSVAKTAAANDKDEDIPEVKPLTRNWAKGARLEFLSSQLNRYKTASLESRSKGKDVVDAVVNEYFKRFNWRQPVSEEPDESAPPPNPLERLSPAEEQMKNKVVTRMKQSISSWLHYRANKIDGGLRHLAHANKSTKDPFAILLGKLSGLSSKPPKRLAPWECFGKDLPKKLADDFDNDFRKSGKSTNLRAKLRNEFLQLEFNKLQPLEKEAWAKRAQDMHDAQVEEAEIRSSKLMDLPPEDRQDCLDRIGDFFYPILDGVHELLNMHVTVLIGGPEPKKGGQLNVLSLHTGTNLSPVPKTWGEADEEKYRLVTQNFKEFLRTAYTQQQQIDAAIPHTLPQNLDSLLVMERNAPDDNREIPKPSKSKSTAGKRSHPEEAQPAAKRKAKASKSKRRKEESDSAEDSDDDTSAEEAFTKKMWRHSHSRSGKRRKTTASNTEDPSSSSDEDPSPNRGRSRTKVSRKRHDSSSVDSTPTPKPKRKRHARVLEFAPKRKSHHASKRVSSHKTRPPISPSRSPSPPSKSMTITKIGPPRDAAKANKMKKAQGGSKTAIMNPASQAKKTQADKTDGPEASARDAKASDANDSKTPAGSPTPAPSRAGSPVPSETVATDLAAVSARLGSISPSANSINPPSPHLDDSNITPVDVSWPDWFRVPYQDMLALRSMPTQWFQLLSLLSRLEAQSNFKKSSVFLPTLYRPAEISVWVGRGRSSWPAIADIDVFGDTWWRWWIAMQPEWREVKSEKSTLERRHRRWDAKVCKAPDAWLALDRPGPNGFMNLVYSLGRWGEARASALQKPDQPLPDWTLLSEDGHDWLTGVADVMWAIECLMASRDAGDSE